MSNKCYSRDDEQFKFDSIGDLFDDMGCDDELKVGAIYYEADSRPVAPSDFYSVGRILEEMDETIELGECYDNDASNVSEEAKAELDAFLTGWIEKHINLRYWMIIGKSRQCVVTEDDLKETP